MFPHSQFAPGEHGDRSDSQYQAQPLFALTGRGTRQRRPCLPHHRPSSRHLVESRRGARGPHPNRIAPEIEARVLEFCLSRPTYGQQRVSNELRLLGVDVSPSGARAVWLRNDPESRYRRLMRLERASRENTTFVLTDEQIRLLERHSPEFHCRRVESSAPGELLNQDTFYGARSRVSARATCRRWSTPSARSVVSERLGATPKIQWPLRDAERVATTAETRTTSTEKKPDAPAVAAAAPAMPSGQDKASHAVR